MFVLWNSETLPSSVTSIPCIPTVHGSRLGCPQLPLPFCTLLSVQRKHGEGRREGVSELQHLLTSLAGWTSATAAPAASCMGLYCPAIIISDLQSAPFINTWKKNPEPTKAPLKGEKNTDFAAAKLPCLLLASMINNKLHLSCTGYNAVLV